jgi:hypothetical protein
MTAMDSGSAPRESGILPEAGMWGFDRISLSVTLLRRGALFILKVPWIGISAVERPQSMYAESRLVKARFHDAAGRTSHL